MNNLHSFQDRMGPKRESTKSQAPNNKQISMTKIPNPKPVASGTEGP
jgi:hypothetical protein